MAKKNKLANQLSASMMDDEWRVRDAVQTMIRNQEICDDKPLYRKAMKQIRRVARKTTRGGSR